MTSPSRRKRQITLHLAWTTTLAISAFAGAQDAERPRRRARTESTPVALPTIEQAPDAFRIRINTEPPTPERLFRLAPESRVLAVKEREFQESNPQLPFMVPGTSDNFDTADSPTLGFSWVQRSRSDPAAAATRDRTGTMGIVNRMGQYPYKPGPNIAPEGAVFADPLVTPDFEVGVDINLGNPTNEFGLLFRAKGPDTLVAGAAAGVIVDQIKINSFYFAVIRSDRVELQKLVEGTPTRLKSLSIPPKTVCRLTVRALGDQIRVLRDGEEILAFADGALTGKHVGVVGLKTEGEPVRFKRFSARGYGGEFQTRAYAAQMLQYRGPNVHHNPLYFEQRGLERHGHHLGNLAQPFIAHGLFLVDAGLWPMSIVTTKPWECLSGDLYARPGDLVPFQLTPPPISAQGLAMEIGVIAAFAVMVP